MGALKRGRGSLTNSKMKSACTTIHYTCAIILASFKVSLCGKLELENGNASQMEKLGPISIFQGILEVL